MDTEREQLSKLKKSTKSLCESASTHYKNECQFAEALCQLGYVQDMNQDPQLGVAFTNFATLVRALADLTYDRLFVNFMSKNFLMTIRTVLAEDVSAAKNDAKKSFEKAFRDYEAKYTKAVQREKRQSVFLADNQSISGLTSAASMLTLEDLTTSAITNSSANNAIHHELNEEKRALQLAMFEIGLNENEMRAKRGVNVLTQLLEMYHVLRRFFREGLETVDQFASYIDSFALQLQGRRKQLSDERKALADFRSKLQRSDSSLMHSILTVPPSLLPETFSVTTTTSTLTPSKSPNNMPSSSSTHNIVTYDQQPTLTLPTNATTAHAVTTSNSSPGSLAAVAATQENADYNLHQPHGDKRCGTQRQGYLMMKKLDSSSSSISQSLKINLLYKRFVKRYIVVQDGTMLIVTDPSHVDAETAAAANATINSINSENFSGSKNKNSHQRHKSTIRLHLITCQAKPVVAATTGSTAGSSENDDQCSFDVVSPRSGALRFLAPSVADRDIWLSVLRNSQQEALQTAFNDVPDDDGDDDDEHNLTNGGDDYADTECDTVADLTMDDATSNDGHATVRNSGMHRKNNNTTQQSKKQRLLPAIKKFVLEELESNRLCCDCNAPVDAATAARCGQVFDPSKDVTWISTNFGTVLCIECSGIHRALGVHVSRVQSLKLDRLSPAELLVAYALGGNRYFNRILEAKLPPSARKPSSVTSMDDKRAFIHQKYVDRAFADSSIALKGVEKQKVAAFLRSSFAELKKQRTATPVTNDKSNMPYSVDGISLAPLITAYAARIDLAGRYFENDQTLLHILMREGDDFACLPLVEFVVQNAALSGGGVHARANNGSTTSAGAHFNCVGADGNTPVHLAALYGRSECLKLLLRAGADWKVRNKRGLTALDEAVAAAAGNGSAVGQQRCVEMLNEAKIGIQYYSTFSNVKYSWNLIRHTSTTNNSDTNSKARSKSIVSDGSNSNAALPPATSTLKALPTKSPSMLRVAGEGGAAAAAAVLPTQTSSDADDNGDDDELVIVDADHFRRDHVVQQQHQHPMTTGGGGAVSTISSPGGSLKPQRQDATGRIAFRALPPPCIDDVLNNTTAEESAARQQQQNDSNEPSAGGSTSASLLQHYLSSLRAGIRRRYSESPGRLAGSASSTSVNGGTNDGVAQKSNDSAGAPAATTTTNSSSSASSSNSSSSRRLLASGGAAMPSRAAVNASKKLSAAAAADTISEDAVSLKLSTSEPRSSAGGADENDNELFLSSTMPRRQAGGTTANSNTSNYNTLLSVSVAEKRRHSAPDKQKDKKNNVEADDDGGGGTLVSRNHRERKSIVSKNSRSLSGLSSSASSTSDVDVDGDRRDDARGKRRGTLTEGETDTDYDAGGRRVASDRVVRNGEVVTPPKLPPKLRRKGTNRPLSLAGDDGATTPTSSSWLADDGSNNSQSQRNFSRPVIPGGAQPPHHQYQRFPQAHQQQYRSSLISLPQIVNNSVRLNGSNNRLNNISNTDIYSQPPSDHHHPHQQQQPYFHGHVRKAISSSSSQFSPGDHQHHMMAAYAAANVANSSSATANLQVSGQAAMPSAARPPPAAAQQQQQYTPQRYPLRHGASFFASPAGAGGVSPAGSTKSYHQHLTSNVSKVSNLAADAADPINSLPRQRKSYSAAEGIVTGGAGAANNSRSHRSLLPDGCIMRCCALYDCAADRPDELSFRAGDIIVVTREHTIEPQWMEGYAATGGGPSQAAANRTVGLFPASFVYRLPD